MLLLTNGCCLRRQDWILMGAATHLLAHASARPVPRLYVPVPPLRHLINNFISLKPTTPPPRNPAAAGLTFLTLLSLIPVLCSHRHDRYYPTPLFSILALLSYFASFFAFIFMIALFSTGMKRFKDDGFGASFGAVGECAFLFDVGWMGCAFLAVYVRVRVLARNWIRALMQC